MHGAYTPTRHSGARSPRQDRDRPTLCTSTSTGDSRNLDAEDLSPRASEYFSDLYKYDVTQQSKDTVRPHYQSSSTGTRTASVVTLFPRGVDYGVLKEADTPQSKHFKELDSAAQKESFFKRHYRRLKEIHDNGPPGDTQMFLAGMSSYLKERKITVDFEMCSPRHEDGPTSQPLSGSVDEHTPQTRKDSAVSYGDVSCTSKEVPVKIRRTVLEMDINKPLPPLPPLDATPTQRLRNEKGKELNINKPLPRTPLYCSSISEKQEIQPLDHSPVDAAWESTPKQAPGSAVSAKQPRVSQADVSSVPQPLEQDSERARFEDFTDISQFPIPPVDKAKPSKAKKGHDALKAKISHPIPITKTINNRFPELTPYVAETAEGKPKTPSSPSWLDKLAHPTLPAIPTMSAMPTFYKSKKRPASDESFACQGLGESNVYAEMVMGGSALSPGETSTETIDETLVPEPLFSGRRSDGSYFGVSNAGAEQGRTGRWV